MQHEGSVIDTVNGVDVIDCQTCRFAHVSPLPSDAVLAKLYAEKYYTECKPDYMTNAEADTGWWQLVYNERLALMERWLQDEARRDILDVGSGTGHFLVEARRRGWNGIGLEPSKHAYKYSTDRFGLTVYQRPFDADAVETFADFDVVNMSEVLEHVPDPAATLILAYNALSPGGILCLVVPNDYSRLQAGLRKAGHEPWWVVPDQHLNYFNVPTLYALVRRCGFSVGDVSTTFPLELFIYMGLNYVGHNDVGREIHAMRKRMEMGLEAAGLGDAKRELYRAFGRRGIGRDIVMLARKPGAPFSVDHVPEDPDESLAD